MLRTLAVAVVVAAAPAAVVLAQTNVLPKLVVTGARLPDEHVALETFPGNVTVLDRQQLADSPAFNLTDALRQQVGLISLDTVGFGQFANISMRGFGERTGTLILVDGVRVNDAGDSTAPYLWNAIPVGSIDRVEIIRGGASTTYGEGALGGVINIITKRDADKPITATVTGSGGNLGFYDANFDVSGKLDTFQYSVTGERKEWDGWREMSGFKSWSAIARPSFDTPVGRFTLGYYFHNNKVENPGVLTPAEFAADPRQAGANTFVFENTQHRGSLDYSKAFDTGWSLLANVSGQSYDTDSSSSFGTGHIEQPNYGATLQASYCNPIAGHDNVLTFGAEAIQQDFQSVFSSSFGAFTTGADNWTASGFVQDTFNLTTNLALTGGVRFDHRDWDIVVLDSFNPDIRQRRQADVWSPKVSLTWQPVEKVTGWISASRSFRLPTGFDIGTAGSAPGQLFFANPTVDPVDARTIEAGARWPWGSLTYYYSQVKDDILFDPFTFQNENFDSVRQGVELSLNSRPVEWVDFYVTTAFTDARFDGGAFDENRLPLVPEWQLTGGVNWRPIKGWQFTLEAVHVRDQVPTNDLRNDFDRNEYTVLNAKASYRWKQITMFAAVNNLLDNIYQSFPTVNTDFLGNQERRYNPAPGLNFQAGATVAF